MCEQHLYYGDNEGNNENIRINIYGCKASCGDSPCYYNKEGKPDTPAYSYIDKTTVKVGDYVWAGPDFVDNTFYKVLKVTKTTVTIKVKSNERIMYFNKYGPNRYFVENGNKSLYKIVTNDDMNAWIDKIESDKVEKIKISEQRLDDFYLGVEIVDDNKLSFCSSLYKDYMIGLEAHGDRGDDECLYEITINDSKEDEGQEGEKKQYYNVITLTCYYNKIHKTFKEFGGSHFNSQTSLRLISS
jgi:hypothetical protein